MGRALSSQTLGVVGLCTRRETDLAARSNAKGMKFELQVEELLRALKDLYPKLIQVERHPRIVLQNEEIVYPDFRLTVELPYERSHYFIECQNRKRSSKTVLHKIQHVRGKQAVKTFIFVYSSSISEELLRAFKAEGVMCLAIEAFEDFLDRISSTVRVQPPLPDPDYRPDHAMLAKLHDPFKELREIPCCVCGKTPADVNRERAKGETFTFHLFDVEDEKGRFAVCDDCYRLLEEQGNAG